ncbi:MAG: hypothetical protein QOJ65_2474 [Fimbriimonadaceae bacterium]|nr:hypothetical protein [Fimbriimonadaceae bacterium]
MRKLGLALLQISVVILSLGCGSGSTADSKIPPPPPIPPEPKGPYTIVLSHTKPAADKAWYEWKLENEPDLLVRLGGQNFTLSRTQEPTFLNVILARAKAPDEVKATLRQVTGSQEAGSMRSTELSTNISGMSNKNLAKLLVPVIKKSTTVDRAKVTTLAKGTGAFPSLTIEWLDPKKFGQQTGR